MHIKKLASLLIVPLALTGCTNSLRYKDNIISASFYPMYLIGNEITKDSGIEIKNSSC